MIFRLVALVVLTLSLGGCALLGGARVEAVATSVQKPSNVALLLEVTEAGEPVSGLEPQNFKLYENGQELSPDEVKRTLLDKTKVASERVVLLVDISGEPSSPERGRLVRAVEAFVDKIKENVAVTVFAYDGGDALKPVGEYPRGAGAASAAPLLVLSGPDGSRNLNGAVIDGVRQLELRLGSDGKPAKLGTLVVVARGPDLANRTPEDRMNQVLESVRFDVIAIGVGEDTPYLGFARSGVVHAQSADTLPIAFEEAASRVATTLGKYYVISYCSPARAGERRVKVEVAYETKTGDERGGSAEHDFDATGFGPGCNPETTPRFVLQKGPAPAETTGAPGAPGASGATVNKAPEATPPGEVVPPPAGSDYKQ